MGGHGPSKTSDSDRARIAMDPKGCERGLAKLLKAAQLSTGK